MTPLPDADVFAGLEQTLPHAIPLLVTQRLRHLFPGRHVLSTDDESFRVDAYAATGEVQLLPVEGQVCVDAARDHGADFRLVRHWGRQRLKWKGRQFEHAQATFAARFDDTVWQWVVAEHEADAHRFFEDVVAWNRKVHGELFVFEAGCFCKSRELQRDIAGFSLDDLVLAGELGQALRADLRRFLASRELYAAAGVPWKRGLLLVGPPGNGKTHAVKGLLREAGLPCIYVKSLSGRHADPHETIPQVFERARELAPCVLVLEDLDALIDDENRSVLLNELDGFARNEGLLTLATTNHPARLDPSLLYRPSRFDRKFHFELPGLAERHRYLERWAAGLPPGRRPSPAGLAAAAELSGDFTYAYLKEATLSARVREVSDGAPMDEVLRAVVEGLRAELASPSPAQPASPAREGSASSAR